MRIAISGIGVAGPALAYWLVKAGHEPLLIERAPQLRSGGYVIDFWGLGYTLAEMMGILPALRRVGYQVDEVRLVDAKGRKAGGFKVKAIRRMMQDRFTSLPRSALSAVICDTIKDRVETMFGDSIAAIDEQDDGVLVEFERSDPRQFDLVIGADGLHSVVRRLAFGAEDAYERDLGYRVAAFELAGYRPRDELTYVSFARPGRQLARFSMREDRTLILATFLAEHAGADPHDLAAPKPLLRRLFAGDGWECPQILEAMEGAGEIYCDRVSQIEMPTWSKGRVGLIGDAAACVSFLAGEGTGLALIEAYVLAGELKRAGGDYRLAFRCYQERLEPFILAKQKSARAFAASFSPKTAFGIWVRDQVTKLMAIPLVADFAIGRSLKDDFDLPDYGMHT